ncbi:uncharacterized protein LOC141912176 [Tubulanus polymorphus]|uniref:uncharacterized protein LOC141912176 n=1 Tax=Tubulanus polymorphus TaxID=672921 RepID=UPI003DA30C20
MDYSDDLALAKLLQEEYDNEVEADDSSRAACLAIQSPPSSKKLNPKSIVDPAWEMLDPSPDIRTLFLEFNEAFFWGMLSSIEVRWSPRMTLCAGLCVYEGRGGMCSVRLSQPLLKLRPRKDLVETLLHEMIHAYLFITDNNKDHDGHGPEFQKHMNRLNTETGTSISIYHSFHDEVNEYRKHWWKCNGPCQKKPPYFGFVKRAMNRAPSPRDPWWASHQQTCGGTYAKVKEPEDYGKKKKKGDTSKKKAESSQTGKNLDIRNQLEKGNKLGSTTSSSTSSTGKINSNNSRKDISEMESQNVNNISGIEKVTKRGDKGLSRSVTHDNPKKPNNSTQISLDDAWSTNQKPNSKRLPAESSSGTPKANVHGFKSTANGGVSYGGKVQVKAKDFASSTNSQRGADVHGFKVGSSGGVSYENSSNGNNSDNVVTQTPVQVFSGGGKKLGATQGNISMDERKSLFLKNLESKCSLPDLISKPAINVKKSEKIGSSQQIFGTNIVEKRSVDNDDDEKPSTKKFKSDNKSDSDKCSKSDSPSTSSMKLENTASDVIDLTAASNISCPICQKSIAEDIINNHLDICLNQQFISSEALW